MSTPEQRAEAVTHLRTLAFSSKASCTVHELSLLDELDSRASTIATQAERIKELEARVSSLKDCPLSKITECDKMVWDWKARVAQLEDQAKEIRKDEREECVEMVRQSDTCDGCKRSIEDDIEGSGEYRDLEAQKALGETGGET